MAAENNNGANDSFLEFQLNKNAVRRAYLITYSQADIVKFSTRESFGVAVEEAFNTGTGKIKVDYWACCQENHANGGKHYHASVKLSGSKRWGAAKNYMLQKYGVAVHFSNTHDHYYSAYKYICKADSQVFHSPNHPNLKEIGSPRTKKCMKAFRDKQKLNINNKTNDEATPAKKPKNKIRRLSNFDVSEFMVKQQIKSEIELFAEAHQQKEAGKTELANFVFNRSPKAIQDLIANTWKMQAATTKLANQNKLRMDIIRTCTTNECVEGCNGAWLECANQVLTQNRIHPVIFAEAVRDLLIKGRGKFRNLMIIGPANCGKTFIFKPLQTIFDTFSNPANDKYAWLGAEKAQLIFLNDFRWSSEMIAWKELLLLLEGQIVHLPSPKNHYASDIAITKDTPIVATGKERITFQGRFNTTDPVENEMMDARWKVFEFFFQIPQAQQRELPACPRCFSTLVLTGEL